MGPRHRRAGVRATASTPSRRRCPAAPSWDGAGVSRPAADRSGRPDTVVLGIETSCDETAAACVMGGTTCCRRSCRARSTCTPSSAASCPRSPAGPTSSCSCRWWPAPSWRPASTTPASTPSPPRSGRASSARCSSGCRRPRPWRSCGTCRSSASTTSRPTSTPRCSRTRTSSCPLVVLLVSGGHTMLVSMEGHGRYRLLGQTIDDAAGEAFDKVARYLGLGYPGGPAIDRDAMHGDPDGHRLPPCHARRRPRLLVQRPEDGGRNHVRKHPEVETADVAASFQQAVVDVLVDEGAAGGAPRSGPRPSPSAAAWPPTRCCASSCSTPATHDGLQGVPAQPGHVHRQRRHDRGRRLAPPAPRRADAARSRRRPEPPPPCPVRARAVRPDGDGARRRRRGVPARRLRAGRGPAHDGLGARGGAAAADRRSGRSTCSWLGASPATGACDPLQAASGCASATTGSTVSVPDAVPARRRPAPSRSCRTPTATLRGGGGRAAPAPGSTRRSPTGDEADVAAFVGVDLSRTSPVAAARAVTCAGARALDDAGVYAAVIRGPSGPPDDAGAAGRRPG